MKRCADREHDRTFGAPCFRGGGCGRQDVSHELLVAAVLADQCQRLSDFDLEIWRYAEPAWREYRSARAYVDLLRDEGFEVEVGSGEMPTAFLATWTSGSR